MIREEKKMSELVAFINDGSDEESVESDCSLDESFLEPRRTPCAIYYEWNFKKRDNIICLSLFLFFVVFFCVGTPLLVVYGSESEMDDGWGADEVDSGLFVGGASDMYNITAVKNDGIGSVLSILENEDDSMYWLYSEKHTSPMPGRELFLNLFFPDGNRRYDDDERPQRKEYYKNYTTLFLPARDENSFYIAQYFPLTNDFLRDAIEEREQKVLVHCHMGRSRSVTIAAAYLMQKYCWDERRALTHIHRRREEADPIEGFRQQLREYWDDVLSQKCI